MSLIRGVLERFGISSQFFSQPELARLANGPHNLNVFHCSQHLLSSAYRSGLDLDVPMKCREEYAVILCLFIGYSPSNY